MSPPQKLNFNIINVSPIRLGEMGFLHDNSNLSLPLTQDRIKVYAMVQNGFAKNKGDGYYLTKKGEDLFRGRDDVIKKQLAVDLVLALPEKLIDQFLEEYNKHLSQSQSQDLQNLNQEQDRDRIHKMITKLRLYLEENNIRGRHEIDLAPFLPMIEEAQSNPNLRDQIKMTLIQTKGIKSEFCRDEIAKNFEGIIDRTPEMIARDQEMRDEPL